MQRLVEAEREQSVLNEAETFAGVTENEILLFRNQLKVVDGLALAYNLLLCSETKLILGLLFKASGMFD